MARSVTVGGKRLPAHAYAFLMVYETSADAVCVGEGHGDESIFVFSFVECCKQHPGSFGPHLHLAEREDVGVHLLHGTHEFLRLDSLLCRCGAPGSIAAEVCEIVLYVGSHDTQFAFLGAWQTVDFSMTSGDGFAGEQMSVARHPRFDTRHDVARADAVVVVAAMDDDAGGLFSVAYLVGAEETRRRQDERVVKTTADDERRNEFDVLILIPGPVGLKGF